MSDELDGVAVVGLDLQLPRHDRLTTDHARLLGAWAGPAFAVSRAQQTARQECSCRRSERPFGVVRSAGNRKGGVERAPTTRDQLERLTDQDTAGAHTLLGPSKGETRYWLVCQPAPRVTAGGTSQMPSGPGVRNATHQSPR